MTLERFITLSLAVFASLPFLQAAEPDKNSPNILWFVVEDMSAHFSCYGEKHISTPHVDELASSGTRFANAYVTAPVCSASRSAMITGMYQTSIGAHHHRSGRGIEKIHLPVHVTPLPSLFQKAGYFTCIGDGLPQSNRPKKSTITLGKTDYNFAFDASTYHSHDWAERKPGQPFFMQVQLAGGKLRGKNDATAENRLRSTAKLLSTSTDPANVALPPYYPRHPSLLLDWAAYLDSVRTTDDHVGKVINRLKNENLLDNTLIIFMTDHGASHARGKQFLYDEGTHIPFIIRGPGIARGKVRSDLIEHIDMAAISLATAGIPIPPSMQAQNVLAPNYAPRTHIFSARDRCDETEDRIRSVRTDRYLYIRNFHPQRPHLQPCAYKDGKTIIQTLRQLHSSAELDPLSSRILFQPTRAPEELYEWKIDTWQLTNLATNPEHQTSLIALRTELNDWMERTHDQGRTPETESRYDSDMADYANSGDPQIKKNIATMKKWRKEGK